MGRHSAIDHAAGRSTVFALAPARTSSRRRLAVTAGRIAVAMTMLATLTASAWGHGAGGARSANEVTTLEALTSNLTVPSPPAALLPRTTNAGDVPRAATAADDVSRSMPRTEFRTDGGRTVECSGRVPDVGKNGHVPDASLCDLWQAPYRDRADAVVTITQLNEAYTASFGKPMCLTSAYRTLEEQAALRRKEPELAAPVGLSNHGWGLAVDFCRETYSGAEGAWLGKNAAAYGWANPAWAHKGGSGPFEPWHWEYFPGVKALVAAGLER